MQLRTAIIDDDKVFCQILEHYINKVEFIELRGMYHNAASAFNEDAIRELDLLFLDVEMPEMTGIELLESLGEAAPKVIVVSRKKEYGVEAFDHCAVDYLHKPVSFGRFMKAADKVRKLFASEAATMRNGKDYFFVRSEGLWKRLAFSDILMIKGHNNSIVIRTEEEDFSSPMRLKDIYNRLPPDVFMKVHRSYIVHLAKISKVDGEVLEIGDRTVPVSNAYIHELYERLKIEK